MKCFAILLAEFFRHAYFKVLQFWEVLIFEPCLFSRTRLLLRKYGIQIILCKPRNSTRHAYDRNVSKRPAVV